MQKEFHESLGKHSAPSTIDNSPKLEQNTSKLLPSNGNPSNSSECVETDI